MILRSFFLLFLFLIKPAFADTTVNDVHGNKDWRKSIPGAYRSPLGIQLHRSCIDGAIASGHSREEIINKFEKLLEFEFKRFGSDCKKKYPELTHYTNQWVTQFRRTILTCDNTGILDKTRPGKSYAGNNRFTLSRISKSAVEGIDDLSFIGNGSSYKTYIPIAQSFFDNALDYTDSHGTRADQIPPLFYTLAHEIFHFTDVNNRKNHSTIENVRAEIDLGTEQKFVKKACSENELIDRILVVEGLCSQGPQNFHQATKAKESQRKIEFSSARFMFRRMADCGFESGCKSLFDGALTDLDLLDLLGLQSQDLKEARATSLCQKISDQGYCDEMRITQRNSLFYNLKQTKEYQQKITEKLQKIFPTHQNQVPAKLIELVGLKDSVEKLKQNSCFNSISTITEDGSILVRNRGQSQFKQDAMDLFSDLATHTKELLGSEVGAMTSDKKCSNSEEKNEIKNFFKTLFEYYQKNQEEDSFNEISNFLNRMPSFLDLNPTFNAKQKEWLKILLGEDDFNEMMNFYDRFHPLSDHFDCFAAGLAPFATAELSLKTLKKINRDAAESCTYLK